MPDGFVAAHAAVRGMVAFCDEQHTQFLDPQAYQRYQAWSRGDLSYAGIGVRLKGAQRTITEVYAGGPADRAGLLTGDAVLAVNGVPVDKLTAGDTSDLSGELDTPTAVPSERYALPVVVLVNEATASMGEIFAAALQEHGVASVVGSTTAGDVARAQLHPLPDGSAPMVTEMEVRSPAGKVLNKVGVVPDDIVAVDPAATLPGVDPVLDEAVALLQRHQRLPVRSQG